jgi:hypothetical protein
MREKFFVVWLIMLHSLLVIGCCNTNSSISDNQPNDDPVTLTHRNQSDYDVYGYYVNRELVETKVVRRGESPVTLGTTSGSWTYPDGGSRTVNEIEYETFYFYPDAGASFEEWIIGQPVSSADTIVSLNQFTPGIAIPEVGGGEQWFLLDPSPETFNDRFNPETNITAATDDSGDINLQGSILNDGIDTLLSGESEETDN